MAKPAARTRVSRFYKLGRDQGTLDFVDVPIGADIAVFLDPSRIRGLGSTWASECNSLLQYFFEALLGHVQSGNKAKAMSLLKALSERNEFHLGLSKGLSSGRAFGDGYSAAILAALRKSKAGTSGLLQDLEDTVLFIEGVGADRISDAVCNILRGPLIKYTQDMCNYYGIPMELEVDSGPIWNPETEVWENELLPLPVTPYGKVIFVPKVAVRRSFVYDSSTYFTHYLLPMMQEYEKGLNSSLVFTLKDGTRKVTKKSLKEKYGVDKLVITEHTTRHPGALDRYRAEARRASRPMTHEEFSDVEEIPLPNFEQLLKDVTTLKPGKENATAYENAIEKLLTALFFPSLSSPTKQHNIHEGRKRIDITYVNNPRDGFFAWLAKNYSSAHIFIECKNYGKEIGNPEFDQLAGRFSPSRGQVGILICRSVQDADRVRASCKDTANDARGFIIVLTDDDLEVLVHDYVRSSYGSNYDLLMTKFRELIM